MVCALAKADASKADDRAAAMAEAVRLWWQVDISRCINDGITRPASN